MNPCEMGFRCPFKALSDDGEPMCTEPYLPGYHSIPMTFTFVEDTDCSLIEDYSEMDTLMEARGCSMCDDRRLMDYAEKMNKDDMDAYLDSRSKKNEQR